MRLHVARSKYLLLAWLPIQILGALAVIEAKVHYWRKGFGK